MRHLRMFSTMIVATAFVMFGALAPQSASGQARKDPPKKEAPGKKDATPAPKVGPYKPVAIKLPASTSDTTLEAFRNELYTIADKKDRAALTGIVASSFFWIPDDKDGKDAADKSKSGIDNLSTAIGLTGKDPAGWGLLAEFADETTNMPHADRQGVICAPTQPVYDDKEAEAFAEATQTDEAEWAFPIRNGVEVRAAPLPRAQVIEKLGLHLVQTVEDKSPAAGGESVKIVTPSGKTGYVPAEALRELGGMQLCYVKEGGSWKIAGFLGRP